MGVVVKDTNIDTKMAAVITTANSRNNRPSTPPMNKMGMNTATKEMLMATTVNPMSREPCKHACSKGTPRSRCRVMFSKTTIASSTTKPVAMVNAKVFPNMVLQMVSIGEETGALDSMLSKVADFYEAEVDDAVDALSSLMEPMIMVVLGVLIGGMVIAMYLPIFKMGQAV